MEREREGAGDALWKVGPPTRAEDEGQEVRGAESTISNTGENVRGMRGKQKGEVKTRTVN